MDLEKASNLTNSFQSPFTVPVSIRDGPATQHAQSLPLRAGELPQMGPRRVQQCGSRQGG